MVYCSVMAPLGIVGAWTVGDRREPEPGLHLALHPKTVTEQVLIIFLEVIVNKKN